MIKGEKLARIWTAGCINDFSKGIFPLAGNLSHNSYLSRKWYMVCHFWRSNCQLDNSLSIAVFPKASVTHDTVGKFYVEDLLSKKLLWLDVVYEKTNWCFLIFSGYYGVLRKSGFLNLTNYFVELKIKAWCLLWKIGNF